MSGITYDPEKFQLTIARLKREGHTFEIAVDPDAALAFKEGKKVPVSDILKSDKVFADVQKGQLASEQAVQNLLKANDATEACPVILKHGEVHFTTRYLQQLRDKKHKQIVQRIHAYGIDPRTKAPHPFERIERGLVEAKVHIDERKSVESQVDAIVRKLQPILPISFAKKTIRFTIPAQHAAKAYSTLKNDHSIAQERWLNDGSLEGQVTIPAGLEEEFYDKINTISHGTVKTDVLETRKGE